MNLQGTTRLNPIVDPIVEDALVAFIWLMFLTCSPFKNYVPNLKAYDEIDTKCSLRCEGGEWPQLLYR